jgi:hypothetical protein
MLQSQEATRKRPKQGEAEAREECVGTLNVAQEQKDNTWRTLAIVVYGCCCHRSDTESVW